MSAASKSCQQLVKHAADGLGSCMHAREKAVREKRLVHAYERKGSCTHARGKARARIREKRLVHARERKVGIPIVVATPVPTKQKLICCIYLLCL
jgi:hypothetical protein